jgi:signal transduction histidine kinase
MLFLSRNIEGSAEVAGKIKSTAESLIRKMNEIIWTMNYEQDSLDSLIAYIRINAAETLDNASIRYRFHISDPIPDLPVNQKFRRNVYLAVKEAVHNIIKHAAATEVSISILTDQALEIAIQDNGKGFDHSRQQRFGNGIKNIEQRMRDLGGRFELVNEQGTLVRLSIPLPLTI